MTEAIAHVLLDLILLLSVGGLPWNLINNHSKKRMKIP